jgi:hypothetical protein
LAANTVFSAAQIKRKADKKTDRACFIHHSKTGTLPRFAKKADVCNSLQASASSLCLFFFDVFTAV